MAVDQWNRRALTAAAEGMREAAAKEAANFGDSQEAGNPFPTVYGAIARRIRALPLETGEDRVAQIVKWLRGNPIAMRLPTHDVAVLHSIATAIERGDWNLPAPPTKENERG